MRCGGVCQAITTIAHCSAKWWGPTTLSEFSNKATTQRHPMWAHNTNIHNFSQCVNSLDEIMRWMHYKQQRLKEYKHYDDLNKKKNNNQH